MQFNKKFRPFAAALLVVPVTAALVIDVPTIAAAENPYVDVKTNDGHYEAIVELTEQGIISGVSKKQFQSTKAATRGEAALFIANALKLNTTAVTNPNFKDLFTSSPYYGAVAALNELNIIGGYTDGTFRPDGTLKRSEISKMLTLAFELEMSTSTKTKFTDVNTMTDVNMKRYIQTLVDYGITTGTTATTFSPYGTLTRGQLATFLQRSINAASNEFKIISVE